MRRAFRDAYNRELAILKERSREFAADYPGLADRLGGLLDDNIDPAIAGLLEGSAFLAARVQMNIEDQFRTFTREMLDQVFPNALAPTPSAMLVRATPPYDYNDIFNGLHLKRGEYLDARFLDADKQISCRFRLAAPLTLWPLRIIDAKYHASAGPINALGKDSAKGTRAGMSINLSRVNASGTATKRGAISDVQIDELTVYLTAPHAVSVAMYEQIHCAMLRVSLRYLDGNGDPVFRSMPLASVEQIGFSQEEQLFPHDGRLFNGFSTLREAFVFPQKFMGFRLTGLKNLLRNIKAPLVTFVLEFDRADQVIAAQFSPEHLTIQAAPAVNLFEDHSAQVQLDKKRHEFIVTPTASPSTHYEIHQVTEVYAHYAQLQDKVRVYPLYAPSAEGKEPRNTSYFTARIKTRRLTLNERKHGGMRYRYRGTETYISLYEPPDSEPARRLQVRALCSNRHLPEYLPIASGKDDFIMCDNQDVSLTCIAGPTPPRESVTEIETAAPHRQAAGDPYWRLLSYLSLNHYGLVNRDGGDGPEALRELLALFADMSDVVTQAQLKGLRNVETRPAVRTIKRGGGYHTARGLEIRLTFDEDDFEGSGIIFLGAVLDRFLAEYAAVNSFTQCVIISVQRGEIKTWPPRTGSGPLL